MTFISHRITSPAGALLKRGDDTREAILKALPGAISTIAERAKIRRETVGKAIKVLIRLGVVETLSTEPSLGGPREVWSQVPGAAVIPPPLKPATKIFQDPQRMPNPVTEQMRAKATQRENNLWSRPVWTPPAWTPPRGESRPVASRGK